MFYEQLFTDVILYPAFKENSIVKQVKKPFNPWVKKSVHNDDGYTIKEASGCLIAIVIIRQV